MFERDLPESPTALPCLLPPALLLQGPIKSRPADPRQLTHPLDTQTALHRHHLPDLVVDAVPPDSLLLWRRASTFCKAPLKKSTSSVLSRHQPLQLRDLLPQFPLLPIRRWPFPVVDRLQLITPLVQHAADAPPVLGRKRDDVVAALQPLHRHLPECLGISSYSSSLPLAVPFPAKCANCECLT